MQPHPGQPQNQALPVPADQFLQNQMVNQIPPPPQPQSQHMLSQQELYTLHTALINVIQGKASNNPLRAFMFNLYSQGQYNNTSYTHLLTRAAGYASMLRDYARYNDYINFAAEQSALTELVILVSHYPQLANYIDQHTYNTLQQIERERNQVQQQMQQYSQWLQNQMSGGQQMGGWQNQSMQGGIPASGGGAPMVGSGGGSMPGAQTPQNAPGGVPSYGMGGAPPPGHGSPQGPGMSPQPPTGGPPPGAPAPANGGGAGVGVPIHPSGNATGAGNIQQNVNRMVDSHQNGVSPQPNNNSPAVGMMRQDGQLTPNNNAQEQTQNGGGNQMSETNWTSADDRQLSQELHRQVRRQECNEDSQSQWYRVPLAHRPDQRLVRQRGEDGTIYYRIEDIKMEYTDHEDNLALIDHYRRHKAGPKIERQANWSEVTQPQPITQSDNEDEDDEDLGIGDQEPVILSSAPRAYSYEHAIAQVFGAFESDSGASVGSRVLESDFELCTPIHLTQNQVDAFKELLSTTSIIDLIRKFQTLGRRDYIPSYIWYMLHDKLTRIFTDQLVIATGDGDIYPDSFIDDFKEALGYLTELYDDDSPSFKAVWTRIHQVMIRALGVRIYSEENTPGHRTELFEQHTLTYLPWSAAEIGVVVNRELSYLNDTVNEDFQLAVEAIIRRTQRDKEASNRRLLVTADHVWMEVVSSEENLAPHIYLRRID